MTVAPLSGARAIWQILGATSIEICHFGGSLIDKPAGILNESAAEKHKRRATFRCDGRRLSPVDFYIF
jgi:hypothetical protein